MHSGCADICNYPQMQVNLLHICSSGRLCLHPPHILNPSKQKTHDAVNRLLTAIKKYFQGMTWNTEPLLTRRGPRKQLLDKARNNLSAARDQFFLHSQQRSFFIMCTDSGQSQTLWASSQELTSDWLCGRKCRKEL